MIQFLLCASVFAPFPWKQIAQLDRRRKIDQNSKELYRHWSRGFLPECWLVEWNLWMDLHPRKCPLGLAPTKMSIWTCTHENVHLDLHPQKCPLGLALTKMSNWTFNQQTPTKRNNLNHQLKPNLNYFYTRISFNWHNPTKLTYLVVRL